jgi:hypothetical protein
MELIYKIVSLLKVLIEEIPTGSESIPAELENWKFKRVMSFAIPIFIDTIGVIALVWGLVRYKPFEGWTIAMDSLKFSLPFVRGKPSGNKSDRY